VITRIKVTLIKFLQAAGYQVSIISGQDESFGDVASETGMKNKGVSYLMQELHLMIGFFPARNKAVYALVKNVLLGNFKHELIRQISLSHSFFYLNFQAAHFPYSHPKWLSGFFNNLISSL